MEKVEFHWNLNTYLSEHIKHADAKALAYLGLMTFIGGYLLTAQKDISIFLQSDLMRLFFLLIGIGLYLWTLIAILLVNWPRTSAKSRVGHIFWGNIANFDDKAAYFQSIEQQTMGNLEKELIHQNYHLSIVNSSKYQWVATSTKLVMVNIFFWLVFITIVNQSANLSEKSPTPYPSVEFKINNPDTKTK